VAYEELMTDEKNFTELLGTASRTAIDYPQTLKIPSSPSVLLTFYSTEGFFALFTEG